MGWGGFKHVVKAVKHVVHQAGVEATRPIHMVGKALGVGGGGKKGGKKQVVGYGYGLDFVYAYCEKADFVSGWKVNDKVTLNNKDFLINSDDSDKYKLKTQKIEVITGVKGKPYSSITHGSPAIFREKNLLTFFLENYEPIDYPNNVADKDYKGLKLSNICFMKSGNLNHTYQIIKKKKIKHSPLLCGSCNSFIRKKYKRRLLEISEKHFYLKASTFIGDNTRSVPKYNARISRFWLKGLDGENHYCKLGKCSINPIDVLIELLCFYGGISASQINSESFDKARDIIKDEGLGISFLMTTEQKLVDWIKTILKIVDGILYFDVLIGEWKIRLFRPITNKDYFVISEENCSKIEVEGGSWDNVYSKIILKYTDTLTGRPASKSFENKAVQTILGYDKTMVEDYKLVGEEEVINIIGQKLLNKYARPLATIKARLSVEDIINVELGDIIKLSSETLSIPEKLFRVVEMSADKEEDTYIEIKGVEELWSKDVNMQLKVTKPNYNIMEDITSLEPAYFKILDLPSFFFSGDEDKEYLSMGIFVSYPSYETARNYSITDAGFTISDTNPADAFLCRFAQLKGDADEVIIEANTSEILEDIEIVLEPTDKGYDNLPLVSSSDEEWYGFFNLILINNELFSYKKLERVGSLDDHTYKITGLIRLFDVKPAHKGKSLCLLFELDNDDLGMNLSSLVKLKGENGTSAELNGYLTNIDHSSKAIDIDKEFNNTACFQPLTAGSPIAYTDDDTLYLKFRERVRDADSTDCFYKDIRSITAGENEDIITEITDIIIKYADTSTTIDVDDLDFYRGTYKGNLTDINSDITKDNIKSIAVKVGNLTSEYIDIYIADKELY